MDQPEENLDPQSIYDELVVEFQRAKLRRQVIIVMHSQVTELYVRVALLNRLTRLRCPTTVPVAAMA